MLSIDDIVEILSIPLLGIIPESNAILKASNIGIPVIHDVRSNAAKAYLSAVNKLLGNKAPQTKKTGYLDFFDKIISGFKKVEA